MAVRARDHGVSGSPEAIEHPAAQPPIAARVAVPRTECRRDTPVPVVAGISFEERGQRLRGRVPTRQPGMDGGGHAVGRGAEGGRSEDPGDVVAGLDVASNFGEDAVAGQANLDVVRGCRDGGFQVGLGLVEPTCVPIHAAQGPVSIGQDRPKRGVGRALPE